MKKISLIGLAIIALSSCKKKEEISACLSVDQSQILTGQVVQFENCSDNYVSAEWDFGDGSESEIGNTSHRFEEAGEYTVRLRVLDLDGNTSESNTTVEVNDLRISKIKISHSDIEDGVSNGDFTWSATYNFSSLFNNNNITIDTTSGSYTFTYENSELVYNQDLNVSVSQYDVSSWWGNTVFTSDWMFNPYDEVTADNTSFTKEDSENSISVDFEYELSK